MTDKNDSSSNKDNEDSDETKGNPFENVDEGKPLGASNPNLHKCDYDPHDIYIRSSDKNGHQTILKNLNIPKDLGGALAEEKEADPRYRTLTDVGRTLIYRGLWWTRQQSENKEFQRQVDEALQEEALMNRRAKFEQDLERIQGTWTVCQRYAINEYWEELANELEIVRAKFLPHPAKAIRNEAERILANFQHYVEDES